MKSIFLLSTKLRVYLTELPPIILLAFIIPFNDVVDYVFKLYPLIIFLSAVIIFIPIYFTRGVVINYDELRCIGIFSSKDRALTGDDKTLVITCLPKRRIRIELNEKSGSADVFTWSTDVSNEEINIFRAKARGTEKTAVKLLAYFGVEKELARSLLLKETGESDLGEITVSSEFHEEGKKLRVHFNKIEEK